ncbi:DUF3953 domain-containing protein [Bacillus cereus]|uniref:DUF3953 domain-containing protein n=1 Tax=Bacillus cereus TaxID=1396 RepID=UPI000330FE1B|nr:DUF3953 domain-containing protein [Bacillus cereus]EOO17605.1 hypothetical protein IG9_02440 [Bacillus cereus HuA2-9]
MLKGVRITFSLIALSIAIYSFIAGNRGIMPYMFIFLGSMAFIVSIEEMMEHKKVSSTFAFLVGAAVLYLGISEILR